MIGASAIADLLTAGHDAANVSASKAVPIIPLNLRRVTLIIDSSSSKVMKKAPSGRPGVRQGRRRASLRRAR
jgi:hypothetical protein